ncbi:glycosyltransferase [Nitrososphaera sp.]|uniref:glycosyltransferase family 2 protein n=1 Tax=Nitrososphaera sp. TaxID=1971748 RepID=UPI00185D55C8|nr:glycosyltransferase [Nitrososphaera sp.]NWG36754.1 glycosyltransferase family 2 protein [Nitrososphaera sp.]
MTEQQEQQLSPSLAVRCQQTVAPSGRIRVSKKAWAVRVMTVVLTAVLIAVTVSVTLETGDPFVMAGVIIPTHSLAYLIIGWFFFRSPATGKPGNELVSVIVPIYNQKGLIEMVIDAIFRSTYQNIEVIAVNDGSTDGTKEVLDRLAGKYPKLKVIHKKNEGKRKAVASAFVNSHARYVVLIDSDSIVEENAISEMMKAFSADPKIGGVVGYAKVWNAKKNVLTKCQDVWYDYSFNIRKCAESRFGAVMCLSGCLAGYRREAIADYIPFWIKARLKESEDRELTTYVIAPPKARHLLTPGTKKMMRWMSQYDDAEDRGLTGQALIDWKSVYVPSAVVYTDVPENVKVFLKQQKRWKKGTLRVNFFVSGFFWRRNPIMSLLLFYVEFMLMFTNPLILLIAFVYEPVLLNNYLVPAIFLTGSVLTSFGHGLDYKFRDRTSTTWYYKPLMNLITAFVISWIIFPAIWSLRRNEWGTR